MPNFGEARTDPAGTDTMPAPTEFSHPQLNQPPGYFNTYMDQAECKTGKLRQEGKKNSARPELSSPQVVSCHAATAFAAGGTVPINLAGDRKPNV